LKTGSPKPKAAARTNISIR